MPKKAPHTRRLEEGGGMEHFREALAEVLERRVEFPRGVLVTLLEGKVTRNTLNAKAVISVMPETAEKEVIEILKQSNREIMDGLATRLRLRRLPKIFWTFDRTEAVAANIEGTINQLKQKGEL